MASYHLSVKSGKKGQASNHAAYIVREGKHGRNGKEADLVATGHGNLPAWANGNPTTFWKMADRHERANGATYREYEVALPVELTDDQRKELADELIQSVAGDKPYQWAIHRPIAALGNIEQPHIHLMLSDRKPDDIYRPPEQHFKRYNSAHPELGGCKKDSGGKNRGTLCDELKTVRKNCAELQNAALEKHGHDARVDHRSNKERGIERKPEKHLGFLGIKKMSAEDKVQYNGRRQNNHPLR